MVQAQKTILATAILQNMAAEWSEEDVAGPDDQGSDEEETEDEEDGAPEMGREEQERAQGNIVYLRPCCRQDFCLLILKPFQ